MAANNTQEALKSGSNCLLDIDEDSSATRLLVHDTRMQALVKNEPITPQVSKVPALFNQYGISNVMFLDGVGDWLSVADNVTAEDYYALFLTASEFNAVL